MFDLIKKDLSAISKDKSQLIELLLMPFILTAVLGLALSSMFNDINIQQFDVGIVNEQNFEQDLEEFESDLVDEGVPEEYRIQLVSAAEEINPAGMLVSVFEDEELEDLLETREFETRDEAREAINNDEIAGVITIPEHFSYDIWQAVFLEEEPGSALGVTVPNEEQMNAGIIQDIVTTFSEQYNLEASIAMSLDGEVPEVPEDNLREQEENIHFTTEEPISAFQYYTIGMGVMYALSTAPVFAYFAFREKETHVFARIMMSGTRPTTFLVSKLFTTTIFTFLQLMILFGLSHLLFGTFSGLSITFWLELLLVTGIYSLAVGSIASILVSLSLYANDSSTISFFGAFVSILAFVGGSFIPVEQFSESLAELGNWTPNGAAMTSYMQLMQGFSFQEIWPLMLRVVVLGVVLLLAAIVLFPKRRLD